MKFEPILVTTIEEVMNSTGNNATKAAALVGVSRSTFLRYVNDPDSIILKMVDGKMKPYVCDRRQGHHKKGN